MTIKTGGPGNRRAIPISKCEVNSTQSDISKTKKRWSVMAAPCHVEGYRMSDASILFYEEMKKIFGPIDLYPIGDGRIHRFCVPGDKSSSKNGWYVLHLDCIPSGAFGSWKLDRTHTWSIRKPIDPLETQLVARRISEARKQHKAEELRRQNDAALQATQIWINACPASANNPYLIRKQLGPYRLRQSDKALLVPLYFDGLLMNLQRIYPDGTKRFLPGGRVKGCYSLIGDPRPKQLLYLCEGWATGASIHHHTGCTVACAMNAGNLLEAGRQLQRLYPHSPLIIAGDDDRQSESEGKGNAGVEAATRTAAVLGCGLVSPVFPADAPLILTDFNDLANWRVGR